jgi:ADP-heptose:LPS heptosyltransferase
VSAVGGERFLVTRLRFLGDVVLCTPLLEALREARPQARIEFLGMAPHVDVLRQHPAVDTLHVLPSGATAAHMIRMGARLRARRFDAVFDLFGNPRSALLTRVTGAPLRVGPDRGVRARLYTHRRGRPSGDRSAVRHHLDKLVPLLGRAPEPRPTSLHVSESERVRLREELDLPERVRVVHPGSTWPDKAWPEDRWPTLVRALTDRDGAPVVVIEPPSQRGLAARVAGSTGARPLDVLDVRSVMALLAHADLYVGNDGGILHAAIALGVPSVGLLGPTEPDIWFPYEHLGPYRVIHRCDEARSDPQGRPLSRLTGIDVEEVLARVDEVGATARDGSS